MEPFTESLLVDNLGLTADSVCMDIGCYDGKMTNLLFERYGCTIHAFEPVPEFYNNCVRRFDGNDKIRLWPYALGKADGVVSFGVKGNMSGEYCSDPNEITRVPVRDVASVMEIMPEVVDLVTMNAESGEYDILERLLECGLMGRIVRVFVQFHAGAPDFEERHAAIRERLTATHTMIFDAPFCWTGWKLKDEAS